MKNYQEFTVGAQSAKAYTTLENIYYVEEAVGINFAQEFFNIANSQELLSFSMARKVLSAAIATDMTNLRERENFVAKFFDAKRFRACDEVSAYILDACKTPKDEADPVYEPQEHQGDAEKK